MSAINRADGATQINREIQIIRRVRRRWSNRQAWQSCRSTLRYLFPSECHALIEQAGLVAESVLGGFEGQPLSEDSEEMIFICRRAQ